MGQISKGTIASISGNTARVTPSDASGKPTAQITIPWHLRKKSGNLKKGTLVVYVVFEDFTGLLLGRADGEWGEYLPNLTAEEVTVGGVGMAKHKHGGVETGSGTSSTPK